MSTPVLQRLSRLGIVAIVLALVAAVLATTPAQAATGAITGKVTKAGGTGLDGITVEVYESFDDEGFVFWEPVASADTLPDGTYAVGGLQPGTYRVGFVDYADETYVSEYWDNKVYVEDAQDVVVTSGGTTSGKNAELAVGGKITGSVTLPGGAGAEDAEVDVFQLTPDGFEYYTSVTTGPTGAYSVGALPTGTYRLGFYTYDDVHAQEFWNDKATLGAADDIAVTAGSTTSGKNAQLSVGGKITGKITKSGGSGIGDVSAVAFQLVDGEWEFVGVGTSSSSGSYTISGLSAGTYRIGYFDENGIYATEFYNNKATIDAATNVVVTLGGTVTGRNAELAVGGKITGKVTGPTGSALGGIDVTVYELYDGDWYDVGYASTASNGTYTVGGLTTGSYRIGFSDYENEVYVEEFWNDKATIDAATNVSVTIGKTTSGRDAKLALASQPIVNTVAPTVTGTAKVGSLLTASPGTWTPTGATFGYQWLADGAVISGATTSTFTPTAAQQGKKISVRVTATKSGLTSGTATSAQTAAVAAPDAAPIVNTVAPTVTGTAKAGQVLTANPGTWTPTGVTFGYQWLADGAVVSGATSSTFTPGAAQVGKKISVRVTGSKTGSAAVQATSAQTGAIAAADALVVTNKSAPGISGTAARVGVQLTSTPGVWSPQGLTLAYQWLADGAPIAGATGTTFTPTASEVGKKISVQVTASRTGYTSATATSVQTPAIAAAPAVTNSTAPGVTGTLAVGATVTATEGIWSPSGLTFAYQWQADGVDIAGATSKTLVLTSAQQGKKLSVKVTGSRTGYSSLTVSSGQTAAVIANTVVNKSAPGLSGAQARVGYPLTATPGVWSPTGLTFAYEWLADGAVIAGATGTTFTPTATQVGKKISVRVTGSRTGFTSSSATSVHTPPINPA